MTARRFTAALGLLGILCPSPASAELRLSELIVELQPGRTVREDVEVWNDGPDRAFVAAEPREMIDPGADPQASRRDPDPEKLGLLVSPARMILEPGQRRLLRIASVSADAAREHVYRVTVKPVVGALHSEASGIKLLVGYDLLVLVRPAEASADVVARRNGRTLTFENKGNVSVELVDGRQCGAGKGSCSQLPAKRLYVGGSWTVQLPADGPAEYVLKSPGQDTRRTF